VLGSLTLCKAKAVLLRSPHWAAATVPPLVKSCIEHKYSITTGGHNIGIEVEAEFFGGVALGSSRTSQRQDPV